MKVPTKFAPVVPIQIADILQGNSIEQDIFGDYHLILAHDVLDKPDDYRRIYGEVRKRYPESFIILDNSIVELGAPMDLKDLKEADRIINPDCIVIPDVMGEGEATRKAATEFCNDYWKSATIDTTPLMGVIQGSDVTDCFRTYYRYCFNPLIRYIGVPRIITQTLGSRMPFLSQLNPARTSGGVHLLGFSDNLLDDISCARMPVVRGIDSAVPIRAALSKKELDPRIRQDFGPRGDYWDTSDATRWNLGVFRFADSNLKNIRDWINTESKS